MVKEINLYNNEKMMYNWWLKIRWFITFVMFAIGILRISQAGQSYPITIFGAAFVGINLLNILFYFQIVRTSSFFKAIQIVLDIIFATLVVHLTGGIESSFVWIYLLAVITASLVLEKSGGFIAAMIGGICLVFLVFIYSVGWLLPVDGESFKVDKFSHTIFLISYIGLFAGIAFISNFIGEMVKKMSLRLSETKDSLESQKDLLLEKQRMIIEHSERIEKYREVVDAVTSIAGIDHAINNHLTVFSLSLRRIEKAGEECKDERLSKIGRMMADSIKGIKDSLLKFQDLKRLDLIKEKREQQ